MNEDEKLMEEASYKMKTPGTCHISLVKQNAEQFDIKPSACLCEQYKTLLEKWLSG